MSLPFHKGTAGNKVTKAGCRAETRAQFPGKFDGRREKSSPESPEEPQIRVKSYRIDERNERNARKTARSRSLHRRGCAP